MIGMTVRDEDRGGPQTIDAAEPVLTAIHEHPARASPEQHRRVPSMTARGNADVSACPEKRDRHALTSSWLREAGGFAAVRLTDLRHPLDVVGSTGAESPKTSGQEPSPITVSGLLPTG